MAGKIQYLRSEYIQPPPGPPTMDAKNNPLALLAQTCSAIGKDPPTGSKLNFQSKLYSSSDAKKSPTPLFQKSRSSPIAHSSPDKSTSPSLVDTRRASPTGSLKREKSPSRHCLSPAKKSRVSPDACKTRGGVVKVHPEDSKSNQGVHEHKKSVVQEPKRRQTLSQDDIDSKQGKTDIQTSSRHKSLSSPHNSRSFSGSCACPSISSSTESSRLSTHASSVSPQQQMLSLYDPYCMGCQGPHVAGSSCFEGLKSPHLPFYAFTNPASTYPFYAQMLMAATARSNATVDPTPHVCNWVNAGTGSCGKIFATADELFNHLRTHAVATTNTSSASYLMNGLEKMSANPYAAYLSQQAAALAAVSPSAPSTIGTNFFSRSHSPLNRYHPYKSPNMLSPLSGVPSLPIAAGVGPYCSPYALYGQRLDASVSGFSYP